MICCNDCKLELDETHFSIDATNPSGLSRRCRTCQNARTREHYQKHKAKYKRNVDNRKELIKKCIISYKKQSECVKCGYDNYKALEFHHREPKEKSFNISQAVSKKVSIKKLMDEIAKCDVVCPNCHALIHYEERGSMRH